MSYCIDYSRRILPPHTKPIVIINRWRAIRVHKGKSVASDREGPIHSVVINKVTLASVQDICSGSFVEWATKPLFYSHNPHPLGVYICCQPLVIHLPHGAVFLLISRDTSWGGRGWACRRNSAKIIIASPLIIVISSITSISAVVFKWLGP